MANGLAILLLCGPQIRVSSAQDFGRLPLRVCWSLEGERLNDFGIASDNASVLILSFGDGLLKSVERGTGKPFWYSELGGEIDSPALSDRERVYVVTKELSASENADGAENLNVRAISILTGVSLWQKPLPKKGEEKIYLLQTGGGLLAVSRTGKIRLLDKESGETRLEKDFALNLILPPSLSDGQIYLSTAGGRIYIVNAGTLQKESEIKTEITPSALLPAGQTLYVGDHFGNVLSYDRAEKRKRWKTWAGAEITSLRVVSEGLLISSFDNFVYLLSQKNGKRIWKRRLSGRSVGAPLVKDEVGVFSVQGGNEAVFIDLKNGRLINQITLPGENFFISNPASFPVSSPAEEAALIILQTGKGVTAFGTDKDCGSGAKGPA